MKTKPEICYQVNTAFGHPGDSDRVSAYRFKDSGKQVVFGKSISKVYKEIRKFNPDRKIIFEFQPED